MRSTSIVFSSVKKWLMSWNQQVPLSQRESNKLLNALNDSFRHRLDEEYPQHANSFQPSPPRKLKSQKGKQVRQEDGVKRDSAVHSTDRHLAAVLTSPLFAGPPRAKNPAVKRPAPTSDAIFQRDTVNSTAKQSLHVTEKTSIKDASPRAVEAAPLKITYQKVEAPVDSQSDLVVNRSSVKAVPGPISKSTPLVASSTEEAPDQSSAGIKRVPIVRVFSEEFPTADVPAKVGDPIVSKVVVKERRSRIEDEYRYGGVIGEVV